MEQSVIAHEPETVPAPVQIADTPARVGLLVMGVAFVAESAINLAAHVYQELHTCIIENVMWDAMGLGRQSVIECVKGTHAWLPYILQHFTK